MTDVRAQRYAFAGALAVTTAQLLQQVHLAAGPGIVVAAPPTQAKRIANGAARAHSAAAACGALSARLLILERDEARAADPTIAPPELTELGVTVVEGVDHAAWRGTVRAIAAAGGELVAARSAWEHASGAAADDVVATLGTLLRYVDQLAALIEAHEPAPPTAGHHSALEQSRRVADD